MEAFYYGGEVSWPFLGEEIEGGGLEPGIELSPPSIHERLGSGHAADPKAVGSAGLTPLDAPGRFDVSDLVLSDLRDRIRRCLLADRLGQSDQPGMTAMPNAARTIAASLTFAHMPSSLPMESSASLRCASSSSPMDSEMPPRRWSPMPVYVAL